METSKIFTSFINALGWFQEQIQKIQDKVIAAPNISEPMKLRNESIDSYVPPNLGLGLDSEHRSCGCLLMQPTTNDWQDFFNLIKNDKLESTGFPSSERPSMAPAGLPPR